MKNKNIVFFLILNLIAAIIVAVAAVVLSLFFFSHTEPTVASTTKFWGLYPSWDVGYLCPAIYVLGFSIVFLIVVICVSSYLAISNIKAGNKDALAIFELLPIRTGIVDRKGTILYFKDGENIIKNPQFKKITEISNIDKSLISSKVEEVFADGKSINFEYTIGDVSRIMRIVPLPQSLYGKPSAIWISHDISELLEAQTLASDSLEKFRLIMDNAPGYIAFEDIDDDFRFIMFNRNAVLGTGKSAEEIIGKTPREVFSDSKDWQVFEQTSQKAIETGKTVEFIHDFILPDGSVRTGKIFKKALKDVFGKRLLFITINDITDLENARKKIEETQNKLQDIVKQFEFVFDNIPAVISFKKLPDLTYLSGNRQLCKAMKKDLSEIIGKNDYFVLPNPKEAEKFIEADTYASTLDCAYENIMNYTDSAGRAGTGRFYRKVMKMSDGQNVLCVMVFDITEIEASRIKIENSNKLWDAVINAIPFHFFAKSVAENYRLKLCNNAFANFMGRSIDELINKTDFDMFDADLANFFHNDDVEIVNSGKPREIIETISETEYRDRIFRTTKQPFSTVDGASMLLGTSVEITREIELLENERVLNACMESIIKDTDADLTIKNTLEIVRAHMRAQRCYVIKFEGDNAKIMFSAVKGEFNADGGEDFKISRNDPWYVQSRERKVFCRDCIDDSSDLSEFGSFGDAIKAAGVSGTIACGIFIDGALWGNIGVTIKEQGRQFTQTNKSFIKAMAHLLELSIDKVRSRRRLISALEQAQEASRAKSFFLASMSHEIRTPLNVVLGFTELLKDESLDSAARAEYMNCIANSGNALLDLINDILDLSKIETGQMPFAEVKTDIAKLCESMAEIFSPKAAEKNVRIDLALGQMPVVFIDKKRIRQIIFNLLGNAVKFTEKGIIKISADFEKTGCSFGTLKLSVSDSGCGIDVDDQKTIFEAFVQSKHMRGTYAQNQGTGLGLAICKKMLQKMGGSISVKSALNEGSKFKVEIPEVRFDNAALEPEMPQIVHAKENPNSIRVLVVDDVALNLRVVSAMLKRLGAEVALAESAREAMSIIEKFNPNVVITDLWMPEINGAQFAEKLAAKYPKLPIYALTADTETSITFDMSLFAGIFSKPVSIEKLTSLLAKI